ncbi:MAG: adenosylcobinamide-GDP ribazoletransferase [Pseudomonadota bacterium]
MNAPGQVWARAATALRFMTRLPVPGARADLAAAAAFFPLAGAMIGALAALVWLAGFVIGLPPWPAAVLVLAVQLWLTGALHEDGLADCADGLGGGARPERALEIMRDSRIGAYGAAALGLSILARAAALAALGPWTGAAALIVAHVLARAGIVASLMLLPYARADGLAAEAQRAGGAATGLLAFLPALALTLWLGGVAGAVALVVAGAVWVWISRRLMRRLGGYTGDGLGATEQMIEIAALMTFAALWA